MELTKTFKGNNKQERSAMKEGGVGREVTGGTYKSLQRKVFVTSKIKEFKNLGKSEH